MGLFSKKNKDAVVDKKQEKEQLTETGEVKVVKEKKTKKEDRKIDKTELGDDREAKKHEHGEAFRHLIRPLMTEKASWVGAVNQYMFEVSAGVNKTEIKKAIEKLYGVKPVKINIINSCGKKIRFGRNWGKMKDWKKAVITLKPGDKIEVYEGV